MTLGAGDLRATFLPAVGMLGVSLTWRGDEHLDLGSGLDAWRRGSTVGLPLLHPWANRLSAHRYRVDDIEVDLARAATDGAVLPTDGNGLPIHGTLVGAFPWEVLDASTTGSAARMAARFRYDAAARPVFDAFPFAHDLEVEVVVDGVLTVRTTVRPTGDRAVPVSFGWHPWFRIPGTDRDDLVLALPERRHLALDDRMIPTGVETHEAAGTISLRDRSFDDHYSLDGHILTVGGPTRTITVTVDDGYRFAQVFAPAGSPVVCLEPMTARVDALTDGSAALVAPGSATVASFSVSIADA